MGTNYNETPALQMQRELVERWDVLKMENPKLRIRNAAQELGVSEVELLVTQCGENVIRLMPDFASILTEMGNIGKVTAITRNDDVVHERKGVYLNPSFQSPYVGLFVGEDIDLRIFFTSWSSAFALTEPLGDDERLSLQFFAKNGEAIHKIYLTKDSDVEAYHLLVKKYKSEDQYPVEAVFHQQKDEVEIPDSEVDMNGFQDTWKGLKDTHDFFGMLKKYKVTRTQGLRLAPQEFVTKLQNNSSRQLLELAASNEVPIMVFVGNQGMIQIHTGEVKKLMEYGEWYNVLDPDFNLHLKENAICDTWLVKKPTEDGMVTSVEVFDNKGELIVQFFGKRKPGIPELESWRKITQELEKNNAI